MNSSNDNQINFYNNIEKNDILNEMITKNVTQMNDYYQVNNTYNFKKIFSTIIESYSIKNLLIHEFEKKLKDLFDLFSDVLCIWKLIPFLKNLLMTNKNYFSNDFLYFKNESNNIEFFEKYCLNKFKVLKNVDFREVSKYLEKFDGKNFTINDIALKFKLKYSTARRLLIEILKYKRVSCCKINFSANTKLNYIQNMTFLKELLMLFKNNYIVLFTDECSFNSMQISNRCWIKIGKENVKFVPQRNKKLNLILTTTIDGIVHYEFNWINLNSEMFINYIRNLEIKIKDDDKFKNHYFKEKIVVCMDNAKIHSSRNSIEEFKKSKFKFLFSAPYSPQLNLTELYFNYVKNMSYKMELKSR